ncbi:MAG: DUF721 domain-containing protein [Planctomycetaceae bacterium]|nr:DUF721 domain-containing protein [Planctomycetaceae bacterium]
MKRNATSSRGGLSKIGDVLPQLIVRYGLHRRRDLGRIEDAWRQAVGEQFSAVTHVKKIYRGTLTVKVPHNAFIQELSFRQAELVASLAESLPEEKIKKICFVG